MKASDLLVQCLEEEGVKYVFGVPGEENEDLLFSLEQSHIQFVPTRHEQAAAFMANVWGRLTGRAGVCLSTLGPGATNLLTGIADAYMDKAPMVAITGQGSVNRMHQESHQLIDVINLFKPVCKWNISISNPDTITEVVRKAFKLAEAEKPGPTHFELPEDIACAQTNSVPIERKRVRRSGADYKAIREAFDLIKISKKPIIIAGNGAIRKLASKHLRLFVESTKIPVVSTFMGKGAVSDESNQSLFTLGYQDKDFVQCALLASDCIITIGYDIAEHSPSAWNIENKTIVHIDFTQSEVHASYKPTVEVISDISSALWDLNEFIEHDPLEFNEFWYKDIRKNIIDDICTNYISEQAPFSIPSVIPIIRSVVPNDGILISDVGSHKIWLARNYKTFEPNSCIISNGLASMGISVPGAIAAKLAHPDKVVVSVSGDGGFMMNSQEIETAKRLGIGIVLIVFNDNDYGLISWKQFQRTGKTASTQLSNPDFVRYAESFGIKGFRPESAVELRQILQEMIPKQELCIIEVSTDAVANYELDAKLNKIDCSLLVNPQKTLSEKLIKSDLYNQVGRDLETREYTNMKSINPAINQTIKEYQEFKEEEVDYILDKVDKAQASWAQTPITQRSMLMRQAGVHLRSASTEYAKIITEEMGKLYKDAILEVEKCALVCDYYADNAAQMLSQEIIATEAERSYVRFNPIGVVLAVMPWNFPFWQVFRFAVPALMAGNTGVLKHASNVPASALAIEEVFVKAGFPEHVFRTLLIGGSSVERVIRNPIIKAVTLTGSEEAGSKVAAVAGEEIKKLVLELGGSDPFIVLDDVSVDFCVSCAYKGRMVNMGQSCIAAKRFIVVDSVYDEFEKKLVEHFRDLKVGDPMNENTQVGPIARMDLLEEIDDQVQRSIQEGAKLLIGGKRVPELQGAFYEPTILGSVTEDITVFKEETFGPVVALIRARDEQDAIRLANLSPYGLGASIWTKDIHNAEKLAQKIESGSVFINSVVKSDPRLPFGGIKKSGYGRELSHYGIKEFVNVKTIVAEEQP